MLLDLTTQIGFLNRFPGIVVIFVLKLYLVALKANAILHCNVSLRIKAVLAQHKFGVSILSPTVVNVWGKRFKLP